MPENHIQKIAAAKTIVLTRGSNGGFELTGPGLTCRSFYTDAQAMIDDLSRALIGQTDISHGGIDPDEYGSADDGCDL